MFRSLVLFGLASSLLAFGQTPAGVTNNGGYVTTTPPSAPLLTPPNAALPGSGPATGEPPAVGVNDSRFGGSGSVYQPSAGTLTGETTGTESSTAAATAGTLPSTSSETSKGSFNPGITNFSSSAASSQPEESLGDIARRYKAQRAAQHPRQYDNNSIRHASYGTADTNAAALPQGDQASATYGSTGTMEVPEGVKNAGDYAAVQAALARSQAASNMNATSSDVNSTIPDPNRSSEINQPQSQVAEVQQSATPPQSNSSATHEATTPQLDQTANANSNTPAKKQLPASASELPLVGLLGFIALTVGGVFTYRLRRSEY